MWLKKLNTKTQGNSKGLVEALGTMQYDGWEMYIGPYASPCG